MRQNVKFDEQSLQSASPELFSPNQLVIRLQISAIFWFLQHIDNESVVKPP